MGAKTNFDRLIVLSTLALLLISIVLVYSASIMEVSRSSIGDGEYYLTRQFIFVLVSLVGAFITCTLPSTFWLKASSPLFWFALFLLVLVLIVGKEVNEAKRWIALGPINLQPAEVMKLAWVLYLSSYCFRHADEVRNTKKGFFKPFGLLLGFAAFIILQPDFGSTVVIVALTFGILFVAGAGFTLYILLFLGFALLLGLLVVIAPYRMARFMSFRDPWAYEFGSGYQLTQSLMAFGRGGLTGEGLGNSIQKLGYLPEAHTDFVTAILGEEFGFVGMCILILLELIIIIRALNLSFRILKRAPCFQGYVVFAIAEWFALQTFINIGVASALLPTKGLTLPLVSYGGSSLLISMMAIGILLRIDFEWRNRILVVE